jgi:hypothetical protein
MIWPTARSTALAGAMTGLADEADATFFNPAGLAFQTTAKVDVTYADWLPAWYAGMCYAYAAGGAPLRLPFLDNRNAYVSGSLVCLATGETDIVNEHGDFLGRVNVWRGAMAAHAAMPITNILGAGVGLRLNHSAYSNWDVWWDELWFGPYGDPVMGLERGGTATTVAVDIALLYRPTSRISTGAAIVNLGPHIVYEPSDEVTNLPRMAKLGACWTPIENHLVRVRIMPELDKVLVGMFRDTTGRKTLGRKLGEEWRDVWKAAGIEATAFKLVSLRVGYFEDVTNQRGGIMLENRDGNTYHYGIWDALTRKHLGSLQRIGLCWGLGLGSDALRFDISSDAAIYDFPTQNWKLQLTCNDIGGLLRRRS